MAKISARGCYELARWTKVEGDKNGDTWHNTVVLRSDGALLRKFYKGGGYSVWKKLNYGGKSFRKLSRELIQCAIDKVRGHMDRLGFIEGSVVVHKRFR